MASTTSALTLRIISPEEIILDQEVVSVQVPGEDGLFGILSGHAETVSLTDSGPLRATTSSGEVLEFIIHDGFAEVRKNVVTILSRSAEKLDEIDLERAKKAADRAREHMKSQAGHADRARAIAALRRALMRERLSRRYS